MEDKREGVGLPSSLVSDAIDSMNTDSQKATNEPANLEDNFQEMTMNANVGTASIDAVGPGGADSGLEIFTEIDTIDPNRGSNVDRSSAVDAAAPIDKFDSASDYGSPDDSFGDGLMEDTKGSTIPRMAQPVVAESVGQIDYIKWFSELTSKDVASAGGKGASLGEMFSNKFPVPPGYVITAQAYDMFLKKSDLDDKISEIIGSLDVDDTAALNEASKQIRSLIEGGEIPEDLREEIIESYKILSSEDLGDVGPGVNSDALTILKNSQEPIFVSVRSSATTEDLADASFAGQQESFLNVKGNVDLVEHIKRCFSSLYTPRAIFYRKKKGFSGALIAVVVQKMVDSEKSGVVFSRDPVKQDDNIAMEAVFGLGEGIVSGKIRPDNYIINRELEIKDIKVANKKIAIVRTASGSNETVKLSSDRSESQVMSRGEIKEVADFAMKLEKHYDKPQDIEFAIEAGEVYIIQSRPITTLGNKKEGKQLEGNVIVEGLSASPGVGVGTVRIVKSMDDLVSIKKGDVLVTEMTNPDMVVSMQKSVAIVTDEGGMTSHAAIVSREMGIPAIVGTGDATAKLKEGMRVTVDGFNGKVFDGEVAETTTVEIKKVVETGKVKLKVIVDLPDFADRAAGSGIDSVGLTRLEGIIASMGKHPLWYEKQGKLDEYSKILQEGISKIAKPFKSVWVRASDIRTDEFASLEGAPEREINPMLGFHGVRFSLKHPEILRAELKAIKEVAEFNPEKKIGLMFPQIISMGEVLETKKYFDEFKTDNMEFGVMIETPASVQIIEDICDHVDFISFGTNDLTQFTLAVDRGEDSVQHLYNELHPAIFSQIGHVIDVCNEKNVVSSICGQAGSKPEMAEFLFKKGIKSISVNADAAFDISKVIAELEKNESIEKPVEETRVEAMEVKDEKPKQEDAVGTSDKSDVDTIGTSNKDVGHEWGTKGQVSVATIAPEVVKEEIIEKPVEDDNIDISIEGNREGSSGSDLGANKMEISDEERKALKKKKKWEKFKKWKERKKAEKVAKRNEREDQEKSGSGENKGWGKQGEVALPDGSHSEQRTVEIEKQKIREEVRQDQKQFSEEVGKGNPYEDNLLNPNNIEVSAESNVETIDDKEVEGVEKVDDMSHIQEVAKEIAEDVKEDNREALEKRHQAMDRIEVEVESPEEIKEDSDIESTEEQIKGYVEDDVEEKTPDRYVKENVADVEVIETPEEKDINEEMQDIVGEEKVDAEDKEFSDQTIDTEEEKGSISGEIEGKIGSNPEEFEEIGVYNPDEDKTKSEEKQKYKYNFDDWE